MAIEIVDFPMKNGDFTLLCDSSPEGKKLGFLACFKMVFGGAKSEMIG